MDITQEEFNRFLNWLHPDSEQAAREYEALRRRVIGWFERRGCPVAEELADQAFDRVIRRVAASTDPSVIKPLPYFYRVVSNLHLEYVETYAKKRGEQLPETWPEATQSLEQETNEPTFHCLENCLHTLPAANRELILAYYQQNKQAKIDLRKELANNFGLSVGLLRVQVYRIRVVLQKCVRECLQLG